MLKRILLLGLFCASILAGNAQLQLPEPDKSPLDVSYFPVNYPLLKIQGQMKEGPVARVIYSRPRKEGRPVFGSLVEYGKLWRMGANEATEIEFYKNVTISGQKLAKGRYTLFAIVDEKHWTIIFNKETDVWGSFIYNASKDALRVEVPVEELETPSELLCMTFEKTNAGGKLIIAWETTSVAVPFTIN